MHARRRTSRICAIANPRPKPKPSAQYPTNRQPKLHFHMVSDLAQLQFQPQSKPSEQQSSCNHLMLALFLMRDTYNPFCKRKATSLFSSVFNHQGIFLSRILLFLIFLYSLHLSFVKFFSTLCINYNQSAGSCIVVIEKKGSGDWAYCAKAQMLLLAFSYQCNITNQLRKSLLGKGLEL